MRLSLWLFVSFLACFLLLSATTAAEGSDVAMESSAAVNEEEEETSLEDEQYQVDEEEEEEADEEEEEEVEEEEYGDEDEVEEEEEEDHDADADYDEDEEEDEEEEDEDEELEEDEEEEEIEVNEFGETVTTMKKKCKDRHKKCQEWAEDDQCEDDKPYMLTYCRKSCEVCTLTEEQIEDIIENFEEQELYRKE